MQRLSMYSKGIFHRRVLRIADERMSDARHMNANLMRPPRLEYAADERIVTESFEHFEMRGR